jgi:hypothetical protein
MLKNLTAFLMMLTMMVSASSVLANAPAKSSADPGSYLFVQNAEYAILKPVKGDKQSYTLTLHHLEPQVIFFTDRPKRVMGHISLEDFVKLWQGKTDDNFTADAPNVGVNGIKFHGLLNRKNVDVVAELSNPVYDAKENSMTFTAKVLADEKNNLPNHKVRLQHISLFFDNMGECPSCCTTCK